MLYYAEEEQGKNWLQMFVVTVIILSLLTRASPPAARRERIYDRYIRVAIDVVSSQMSVFELLIVQILHYFVMYFTCFLMTRHFLN